MTCQGRIVTIWGPPSGRRPSARRRPVREVAAHAKEHFHLHPAPVVALVVLVVRRWVVPQVLPDRRSKVAAVAELLRLHRASRHMVCLPAALRSGRWRLALEGRGDADLSATLLDTLPR